MTRDHGELSTLIAELLNRHGPSLTLQKVEQALKGSAPRAQIREAWRDYLGIPKRPYMEGRKSRLSGARASFVLTDEVGTGEDEAAPDEPEKPLAGGTLEAPDERRRTLPGRRFLFTAAQNNTFLHTPFWEALLHFAELNDAELHVSRFSYNKTGWGNQRITKDDDELWYDPKIKPYVLDEQVKVADGLIFCGELDILPTAVTPLGTLQNYTGPNSGIVPHTKVHMQSQATMKHEPAKFMYTTGACTLRNYIERKAGQVATFHHVFGALYVEIDEDGDWFARQLMADDNGVFYDIDTAYGPGWSAPASDMGYSLVTLGDIHIEKIDPYALGGAFGMMNAVKPRHVFVHDLIDFEPRNHHNLSDPYFRARQHFQGIDVVEHGMIAGARFLHGLNRAFPDAIINVIRSNHDQAFERWLQDPRGVEDPVNSRYWHEANYQKLRAIEAGNDLDVFVWAMSDAERKRGLDLSGVRFIAEDESVVIHDIEHGMHGHRGPNGARGNPKAFRQLGRKANTGHTHSAGIVDGVWTAGVLAKLDMDYNTGPSSWSHSSIITYPSGKRCIVTQRGNKWRA
ncbi:hypothetical protein HW532_20950 [Kaustia mangrovi]|uniref:A1 protein n=1 Tax=Kaustia mangrovi TaxID=2593653 RepID=A0A7S8C7R8_9HYPH|nr:hypothetical protein [Kaustia mangrovi]QPC44949.1 hypothetical protein HW532_20950 [Kaustia mangrovi]